MDLTDSRLSTGSVLVSLASSVTCSHVSSQLIPFAFGWIVLAYASVRVLVTRGSLAKGQVNANPKLQMYATRYSIRSLTEEKENGKEK